jgi:CYTH domain-containing protein
MGHEIERKFLVTGEDWRSGARCCRIQQGYLTAGVLASARIRLMDEAGYLTIKSAGADLVRREFEYPIPAADARAMLDELCAQPVLNKLRYSLEAAGRLWTVDIFEGALAGLRLAETELTSVDEVVSLPPWVGQEVTGDPRYLNSSLAKATRVP